MLKVAPCTVVRSYNHFFRLDGLLLFCLIMGLRSTSSAIRFGCYRFKNINYSTVWGFLRLHPCSNIFPQTLHLVFNFCFSHEYISNINLDKPSQNSLILRSWPPELGKVAKYWSRFSNLVIFMLFFAKEFSHDERRKNTIQGCSWRLELPISRWILD